MLIPQERPYLDGLNSYYLHLERFIEHLQGEVGSGGIYCNSPYLELLIYFNENEIISNLQQKKGEKAVMQPADKSVRDSFDSANFSVKVYQLEAHAIFFWAQMPSFQRAKSALKSTEIPLPDLIFRLRQKNFSGFIDIKLVNKTDSGILFFNKGERIGGSYSWGKGGMNVSDEDYNTLLGRLQSCEGVFTFGSFSKEKEA